MNYYIEKILSITNQDLDEIDLTKYQSHFLKSISNSQYFLKRSGMEHYRLLAYISTLYNDTKLLDIGTNLGFSALAMSYNLNNKVISYDIVKQPIIDSYEQNPIQDNITFKLGNFLTQESLDDAPFIFLDTAHEGPFEIEVINHLHNTKWKGILGMDDIFECASLTNIWQGIEFEKYNLTDKGHCTGTGFIVFN